MRLNHIIHKHESKDIIRTCGKYAPAEDSCWAGRLFCTPPQDNKFISLFIIPRLDTAKFHPREPYSDYFLPTSFRWSLATSPTSSHLALTRSCSIFQFPTTFPNFTARCLKSRILEPKAPRIRWCLDNRRMGTFFTLCSKIGNHSHNY